VIEIATAGSGGSGSSGTLEALPIAPQLLFLP
jgi:hypothetical protein